MGTFDTYVGARDARIKLAMESFSRKALARDLSLVERMSSRITLLGLSVLSIAPFLMPLWSVSLGLSLMGVGVLTFFFGLWVSLEASRVSDELLAECFFDVDTERPELLQTMQDRKEEGLRERWSSPTL